MTSFRRKCWRGRFGGEVVSLLLTFVLFFVLYERHQHKNGTEVAPRDLSKATGITKDWNSFDQIFAFGDSYTAYFYEERHRHPPFLINKMKEGDKFRMKPNWISFLIEEHNQSTIQTVNFAEGGSVVDHSLIKPGGFGTSLKKQLEGFVDEYSIKDDHTPILPWEPESSLFMTWFGINDILGTYQAQGAKTEYKALDLNPIFDTYANSLETLYTQGARHFLALTTPPFDRAVSPFGEEDVRWALRLNYIRDISSFNSRLYEMIGTFKLRHDDITASVFDTHRLYSRVLDDPQQFEETKMILHTEEVCYDETKEKNIGEFDIDYVENICTNGRPVHTHAWYLIHATYPMHNVTAAKVAQDCFGPRRPGSYCT